MLPRDFDSHPLTWAVHQTLGLASREECKLMDLLPPSVLAELLVVDRRFWADWEAVHQYLVRSLHTCQLSTTVLLNITLVRITCLSYLNSAAVKACNQS